MNLRGPNKGKYMYDLVVIGGGSGGVRASRIAAGHGAKVALVETQMEHGAPNYTALGGTCVNVGCVPKKLLVMGSLASQDMRVAEGFGWKNLAKDPKFDWAQFMKQKDAEITRLNGVYKRMLGGSGVEVITGVGSLQGKNQVLVKKPDGETQVLTTDNVVLCTGGWPFRPDIPGIEHSITSNEVFYLKEQPKRIVVVGGGFIAVEFACIMAGLGSEVTLSYRGDLFLRGFDIDVREMLAEEMKLRGVKLLFNTNLTSIVKNKDGSLVADIDNNSKISCDQVLYATGRVAKTQNLGLEKLGIKFVGNGLIPVNKYSQTVVPNIYAVGDISQGTDGVFRPDLTPVALHEGHCLADTLYGGKDRPANHEFIPSTVFSQPEVGTCGYTEEDAVKLYKNITVFKTSFKAMRNAFSNQTQRVLFKLVIRDSDNVVVGLHMLSEHAAEILQGFAVAMKMGATKQDFDNTIGIHPSSAEEMVTMRTASYKYVNGVRANL